MLSCEWSLKTTTTKDQYSNKIPLVYYRLRTNTPLSCRLHILMWVDVPSMDWHITGKDLEWYAHNCGRCRFHGWCNSKHTTYLTTLRLSFPNLCLQGPKYFGRNLLVLILWRRGLIWCGAGISSSSARRLGPTLCLQVPPTTAEWAFLLCYHNADVWLLVLICAFYFSNQ